jgi:hypothetical protein
MESPAFATSDLALAATLLTLGFPLVDIEMGQMRNRAQFIFDQSDDLQETIRLYWKRELAVEPETYFHSIKSIKNRLYAI